MLGSGSDDADAPTNGRERKGTGVYSPDRNTQQQQQQQDVPPLSGGTQLTDDRRDNMESSGVVSSTSIPTAPDSGEVSGFMPEDASFRLNPAFENPFAGSMENIAQDVLISMAPGHSSIMIPPQESSEVFDVDASTGDIRELKKRKDEAEHGEEEQKTTEATATATPSTDTATTGSTRKDSGTGKSAKRRSRQQQQGGGDKNETEERGRALSAVTENVEIVDSDADEDGEDSDESISGQEGKPEEQNKRLPEKLSNMFDMFKGSTKLAISKGRKKKVTIDRGDVESEAFQHLQAEESVFHVVVDGDDGGVHLRQCHERIMNAIKLRKKYRVLDRKMTQTVLARFPKEPRVVRSKGLYSIHGDYHSTATALGIPSWGEFGVHIESLLLTAENTVCRKACQQRLEILQERSRTLFLLNTDIEEPHTFKRKGGVFANIIKVDNSLRLNRAMPAQEMLQSLLHFYDTHPTEPILRDSNKTRQFNTSLRDIFEQFECDPHQLTVEGLGWHASNTNKVQKMEVDEYHEGDTLTGKLNHALLSFEGKLFPGIIKKVCAANEIRNIAAEYRISVYGSHSDELHKIARGFKYNEIGPYKNAMWVLHFRPLTRPPFVEYHCATLQEQLDNFFLPLFEATLRGDESDNTNLSHLLLHVSAVHLETLNMDPASSFTANSPTPSQWPFEGELPNELFFDYYVWANLIVLNSIRHRRGMNILQYRRGGGNGDVQSFMAGYLLADVVSSATHLVRNPVLQYLYGWHRIGITVSPLRDNEKNIPYQDSPLSLYLHRSLLVSLSTEQPLHLHYSDNPLNEEYGLAQKIFRLSPLDMTELAFNSVFMSNFSHLTKQEWIGENYRSGELSKHSPEKTHVSQLRIQFRQEAWDNEREVFTELQRLKAVGKIHDGATQMPTGLSRWSYLSSVKDVEYFSVLDNRIKFPRVVIGGPQEKDESTKKAAPLIARALQMRKRYIYIPPRPWQTSKVNVEEAFKTRSDSFPVDEWTYENKDSVYIAYRKDEVHAWPRHLPTIEEFYSDFLELKSISDSIDVKDFAYRRLTQLESKFTLHLALNHANEAGSTDTKASTNRDLYQSVKVDTHVHMAAGMTARQLLKFILDKWKNNSDDIAMLDSSKGIQTFGQVMKTARISDKLTVDQLQVQADHTLFERFDNFNNRYNPMENPKMRELFLKTSNFMNGRYFAEIINRCFAEFTKDQFTFAENRLSIYGINLQEWDKLTSWFDTHGMANKHNKWIIQIPRIYWLFREGRSVNSFGQYLQNIFKPLWDASLEPSKHPSLHNMLTHISGFDSVDNEATIDVPFTVVHPWEWQSSQNPPYNYYMYYLYANIRTLNEFRASRGFSTFSFRPHGGESGSDEHLLGCFLTADAVNHGVNLRNDPSMQYLYYLAQIGLAVSPLSNNALFFHFLKNPFPDFFRRGLNVSLSTDDPLMFHQTEEPLIEEYSIAAKVWGFSANDLCEIARNSVLQCGFDNLWKKRHIGNRFYMSSSLGNDPRKTHLSDIRVAFRFETYHTEVSYLESVSRQHLPRFMFTRSEEEDILEQENVETGVKEEKVLLSTHDQEMEIVQREIDQKKEQIHTGKLKINKLRTQQNNLIANITEIVERIDENERLRQEEEAAQKRRPLKYNATRAHPEATLDNVDIQEALHKARMWRPPLPVEQNGSSGQRRGVTATIPKVVTRPLPNPHDD